jgi:hypothetical protein
MLRERLVRPHEDEDVSVVGVLATAGLLVLMVAFAIAVAFKLDVALSVSRGGRAPRAAAVRPQVAADRTTVLSLSGTPQDDLAVIRRAETERLEGHGWVDRQAGVVRIPIGDAMDILARRGLPALAGEPPRQVAAPSAAGRFVDAGR